MDKIIFKIPSYKKYFSTVRLTLSSIANTIQMDVENIEDLKVSISEIMNMLFEKTKDFDFTIDVEDEKIKIEVLVDCCVEEVIEDENNKFSVLILESLVDKVKFSHNRVFLEKNKG